MRSSRPSISFVIPCLNEEHTLGTVLEKINRLKGRELGEYSVETIVSDNGSTDQSVGIAEKFGATVVRCAEKGYGAALKFGIENASHDVVVFADVDGTYDFMESSRLIHELAKGYDLVLGSRIHGKIHRGAMPFLHRYVGTPVLSFFINLLYRGSPTKLSDCNSGFRAFWRESFLKWNVRSKGMEFASEMLVKALKANAKVSEVPISLYRDVQKRTPHLKTWRDGMRHLLQILSESPKFFFVTGTSIWLLSWLTLLVSALFGPIIISFVSVFGVHTMMFALLFSCLGITIFSIGMFLSARQDSAIRIYRSLTNLSEDRLFWYSLFLVALSLTLCLVIVFEWAVQGFKTLSMENETLLLVSFSLNGLLFVANCFTVHIMKRV